jgi:hypothetical protein
MVELEVSGIIGTLDWRELKNVLVFELMNCNNEKELLHIINGILRAVGTKKQIKKTRKKLNLPGLTKEEDKAFKETETKKA